MILQKIHSRSAFAIIVWSGLIVGTLDIFAAIALSGVGATRVLRFISSGLFGRDVAVGGGDMMVVLGLLFHYLIAFTWTIIYFFIFPKIYPLIKSRPTMAFVYGLCIWLVMNLIVLKLSAIATGPFNWIGFMRGAAVLILMIGVPLTWIFHAYYFPHKKR
jgi:hypothetical protein